MEAQHEELNEMAQSGRGGAYLIVTPKKSDAQYLGRYTGRNVHFLGVPMLLGVALAPRPPVQLIGRNEYLVGGERAGDLLWPQISLMLTTPQAPQLIKDLRSAIHLTKAAAPLLHDRTVRLVIERAIAAADAEEMATNVAA